ncbi:MAG: APH(3') family aminoglycoside O-phosphotransferase [Bacilli bacterium]
MNKIHIPEIVKNKLYDTNYQLDDIGCTDSKVLIYDKQVLKIEKQNFESDNESIILKWLQGRLPVPKIYITHTEDNYNYILMSKLKGNMSCDKKYLSNPKKLIKILAKALKMLEKIDISGCPLRYDLDYKLQLAKERVENKLVSMIDAEPNTYGPNSFKDPSDLLDYLIKNKPNNKNQSFVHGDFCLPNIFIDNDEVKGFIDLGRATIADKYNDIALCLRSLEHNLGTSKYNHLLFEELNIEYNEDLIRYYILLDELF